jgi:large subunit ribosomal protein L2
MALIKMKPTSPGTRFVVKIDRSHLHKGGPVEALTTKKNRTGARNHFGRQTTRHIGGGHKQRYRIVDFKRDKDGVPGVVERLEYDPNRTSHLALVLYKDGERRYILAPKGVKAGDEIRSGADAPIKPGNALPLRHIPVGSTVHNIELKVGKGGQLARSAGGSAQFAAREGLYASAAAQVGRDAQDPRRLPRHHRRGRQRRAQPAQCTARPARCAGSACARRCAAWS